MDKRWIGIIIILIAGLSCMYLIVDSSNTVGNAVSVIRDVTVTLPPGYITSESGGSYCVLYNKETTETVRLKCLKEETTYINEHEKQLKTLSRQGDIIIKKNFTNKTLSMIDYENQSSTDKKFVSLIYFDKLNHTFSMQLEHYTNETSKENAINYIIEQLKYDFKQNS